MKLSLSGRILDGGPAMPTSDFVRMAKATGFDMVELRASQVPNDSSDAELVALRAVLDEAGIGVSMLVTGAASDVASWLRVARVLGARNLRAHGTPAELQAACDALDDGMRIVYQMHSGSPFENVAAAAVTLAEIPHEQFGIMPEPANLLFAGETWGPDVFEPLRGRIYGCNAQSIVLTPGSDTKVKMNDGREVPFTRRDWPENVALDLAGFAAALHAVGYDDFINFIDPFCPGKTALEFAAQTAAFAREVLS